MSVAQAFDISEHFRLISPGYYNMERLDHIGKTHELKACERMKIETIEYPGATDVKVAYVECLIEHPAIHQYRGLSLARLFQSFVS